MPYKGEMKNPRTFQKTPPKDAADFAAFRDTWMRNMAMLDVKSLSSGAKIVGFRLALYMHQGKQYAHPSYDDLATQTGMGVRIVQKHTFALEKVGFIFIDRRRNAGNFYFLDAFWEKDAKRKTVST